MHVIRVGRTEKRPAAAPVSVSGSCAAAAAADSGGGGGFLLEEALLVGGGLPPNLLAAGGRTLGRTGGGQLGKGKVAAVLTTCT